MEKDKRKEEVAKTDMRKNSGQSKAEKNVEK